MKKSGFRGIAAVVLVFALGIIAVGFTGCDFLEEPVNTKGKEDPGNPSSPPDPLMLDAFKTLYIKSAGGSDTNTGEASDAPLATVAKALEKVRESYGNGAAWGVTNTKHPLPAEIVVLDTITPSGTVTIDGAGGGGPPIILRYLSKVDQEADIMPSTAGYPHAPLVIVNSGVTVTLRNITLKGLGILVGSTWTNANKTALIRVDGTLNLESGAAITGNTNIASYMADVTGAGPICSNGGGVHVSAGGTFTMNGGTISGNTISGGNKNIRLGGSGAGVYTAGTFTMNGGSISDNTNKALWGDVDTAKTSEKRYGQGGGGGVFVSIGGKFTMKDGTISGNTSNGSMNNNQLISRYNGGGVYVCGSLQTYDDVEYGKSGSSEFIMEGGTISGNTANSGGGVYVYSVGVFTMKGGTISGNKATGDLLLSRYPGAGGGVYASSHGDYGYGQPFTKTGGTIYGETKPDGTPEDYYRRNTAYGHGHAVHVEKLYVDSGKTSGSRNSTAGPGVNMNLQWPNPIGWD
ncbi:MAG: hypothetical protein LBT00_02905 [Spirochaetaceae bacterium]|jgi:hypothetical protein|nr:hypothetical protein [Spirochaetaceae bacterium]